MNINGYEIIDLNDINCNAVIGLRIKSLRTEKKISQTALGVRMGQDQSFVSRLEAGKIEHESDLILLSRVAVALGVNIYDLIKEEEGFIC